ncbi:MAG: ChbG/HpnK family deacetylase [Chloroflexi bacterium]|nr:ChbG/HpnK family deacetylase [Chloroflexota bacterium]
MKQLIVNADDFGRAPGVNRGILEAYEAGIVTSTTVMINYPDAAPGLEQALAKAPDLGIGLHLNLTAGYPVLPAERIPSLVKEDGQFVHIRDWAGHMAAFEPEHVRAELVAQLDRFLSLAGRPPDHLDSHHHGAYLHPDALSVVLEIAHRYNIPMRDTKFDALDGPLDRALAELANVVPGVPALLAQNLIERLQQVLTQGPPPFCPARLEMGFFEDHATLGDLLVILTTLPEDRPTELMCHPGYVDEALGTSGYLYPREREIGHLTHPATLECIRSEGISLINFGDLARSAA